MVEGFVDLKKQLQPAGVDLTLAKVFSFESRGSFDFDNSAREISECKELPFDGDGWIELEPGHYKIQYNELVRVPPDLVALTICRSSLARSGCDVYNGFWDPGYVGRGESSFLVFNPKGVRLRKNARVAQMIFLRLSEAADELYSGVHKNENV